MSMNKVILNLNNCLLPAPSFCAYFLLSHETTYVVAAQNNICQPVRVQWIPRGVRCWLVLHRTNGEWFATRTGQWLKLELCDWLLNFPKNEPKRTILFIRHTLSLNFSHCTQANCWRNYSWTAETIGNIYYKGNALWAILWWDFNPSKGAGIDKCLIFDKFL